jgi:hypothetical protein
MKTSSNYQSLVSLSPYPFERRIFMTPEELQAARRERARRWVGHSLHGYPALADEDETEQTLAAAPAKQAEKKPKLPQE